MTASPRLAQRISCAVVAAITLAASPAWAAITPTGDVSPANPSTWTSSTTAYIGNTAGGSLLVNAGSTLVSSESYLGFSLDAAGTVTLDNATWTNGSVVVGYSGTGTLLVTNGGHLSQPGNSFNYIGTHPSKTGTVTVDGPNSTWFGSGTLLVGYFGNGTLNITNGGQFIGARDCRLGYHSFATGIVTVDGVGSAFFSTGYLDVGVEANGTLNITNGALVTANSVTVAGYSPLVSYPSNASPASAAIGSINFGAHGGTLTTNTLYAAPAQFTGTGTIKTNGLVSDCDLVFDATHGTSQRLIWSNAGQSVNLDLSLASTADLGAGYLGSGSLAIRDGVTIKSANGYLGFQSGSTGTATVDGHALWQCNWLFLGYEGAGTLNIINGGTVINETVRIGDGGGTAKITVDGTDSLWTINGNLILGKSGSSVLRISRGAKVTALSSTIYRLSLLELTVGDGSTLNAGTGTLANSGTLRLTAIPNAAPGSYTPIQAASWSGTGTTQALGGIWNTASHTFTVSPAATGTAGLPSTIDLSQTQRVAITDPTATQIVHANFLATAKPASLTFTAALLTDSQSALLDATVPQDAECLCGWIFSTTGYTPGDPVFLSLQIGPNLDPAALALYYFNGIAWWPYAASDLSYDGTYANFTGTSFYGYAVTTVPEPAALLLLGLGGIPLLLRRRLGTFTRN